MEEKNNEQLDTQQEVTPIENKPIEPVVNPVHEDPIQDVHQEVSGELMPAGSPAANDGQDTVISPEDQQVIDSLDGQIRELMKKYKMTMWALVACIVAYLVFLFLVKTSWSTWVVLAICVVMIAIAVMNTKYSRRIQKLAMEKQKLKKQAQATGGSADAASAIGQTGNEAIVANAASLNDLPRQYTVLDDVEFADGQEAENIVVSPYGVAVVGSPDLKPELDAVLQEAGVEAPIFFYSPEQEVSALAEAIQMEKTIALDEKQIMDILYKLTGLKG